MSHDYLVKLTMKIVNLTKHKNEEVFTKIKRYIIQL